MSSAVDTLRGVVRMCDAMPEDFCQRFTAHGLQRLYEAYKACQWDYLPCQWSERQVRAALRGAVPTFEEVAP